MDQIIDAVAFPWFDIVTLSVIKEGYAVFAVAGTLSAFIPRWWSVERSWAGSGRGGRRRSEIRCRTSTTGVHVWYE